MKKIKRKNFKDDVINIEAKRLLPVYFLSTVSEKSVTDLISGHKGGGFSKCIRLREGEVFVDESDFLLWLDEQKKPEVRNEKI